MQESYVVMSSLFFLCSFYSCFIWTYGLTFWSSFSSSDHHVCSRVPSTVMGLLGWVGEKKCSIQDTHGIKSKRKFPPFLLYTFRQAYFRLGLKTNYINPGGGISVNFPKNTTSVTCLVVKILIARVHNLEHISTTFCVLWDLVSESILRTFWKYFLQITLWKSHVWELRRIKCIYVAISCKFYRFCTKEFDSFVQNL